MKKIEDTPKIMHIGGWTTAVIGAAVFAAVVGVFMYQSANAPIEAAISQAPAAEAPASAKCTNVALNNYPGIEVVNAGAAAYKHGIFEEKMGGTWRCNEYCVPDIDTTQKLNSEKNQEAVKKYLSGKTMGGQAVNAVKSGQGFQELLLETNPGVTMARTIILDSTKNVCMGYKEGRGWSTNYEKMVDTNGTVTAPAVENLTATDAKKYQEEMAAQENAGKDPTSYGPQEPLGAPTSGDKPRSPARIQRQTNGTDTVEYDDGSRGIAYSGDQLKNTREKFKFCKAEIEKLFKNQTWIQAVGSNLNGTKNLFKELQQNYPDSKLKTVEDAEEALLSCQKLAETLNSSWEQTPQVLPEETNQVYSQPLLVNFSGYVDFSETVLKISSPTIICAVLAPRAKGTTVPNYSRCAASNTNGSFNLRVLIDKNDVQSDKYIEIYMVNAGVIGYRSRSSLFTLPPMNRLKTLLSQEQINKKEMTINFGGDDIVNGRRNHIWLGYDVKNRHALTFVGVSWSNNKLYMDFSPSKVQIKTESENKTKWLSDSNNWDCLRAIAPPR